MVTLIPGYLQLGAPESSVESLLSVMVTSTSRSTSRSTDLSTVWEVWWDLQIHFPGIRCWRVRLTGRAAETDLLRAGAQHAKHVAGDVRVGLGGEEPRGAAGEGQVGDAVTQVCPGSSDTQIVVLVLLVRAGQGADMWGAGWLIVNS